MLKVKSGLKKQMNSTVCDVTLFEKFHYSSTELNMT